MIQPKPKLQIIQGEPITVTLKYPTGKPAKSLIPGAPDQVYYTLMDGTGMYLPFQVGSMIDALKPKFGSRITILKRGPRDWQVTPVSPVNSLVNGGGEDSAAILGRCYLSACDIAILAVDAAKQKGLAISPTFEDIRAVAATLLISETGRRV